VPPTGTLAPLGLADEHLDGSRTCLQPAGAVNPVALIAYGLHLCMHDSLHIAGMGSHAHKERLTGYIGSYDPAHV
jgi:hypothetical protein